MSRGHIYIDFDAEDFEKQFIAEYSKYTKEKQEAVKEAVKRIGKELVSDVKSRSPVRKAGTPSSSIYPAGTYKNKGWRVRILRNDGKRFTIGAVQSTEQYRLSHLLELGHRVVHTRNGVKVVTNKRTRPIPHIREPQRVANEKLQAELEKIFEDE